ncbi:sperm-specific sodium:proton exchanger-like [Tubulanus polymorphus]|uniref:sperm-specific sodium:proton exchanger-like n=1 Tax=Tubulanus polymorphus TaxID=672921 RepID=UPI003DA350E7
MAANGSLVSDFRACPPGHTSVAVILFIFSACMIGAISRSLLKRLPIPYTVFLMVVGLLFGTLSRYVESVQEYTTMARADPHIILFVFLPVLVFESAFDMEAHTFFRSFAQILLLSVPGLILASFLTAVFAIYSYDYNWGWPEALMYGSILSATDPVAVVALLKDVGASKHLAMLIEGESLLNDGAAIVMFDIFETLTERTLAASAAVELVGWSMLYAFGGPLYGLVMGKLTTFWLSKIFNDAITEITVTLSVTYVIFYTGENFLFVSGVLAVVVLGVVMSADKTSISPEVEAFLHRFWQMLAYLANTLIFILVGVLIVEQGLTAFTPIDAFYILALYCAVTVIRGLMILLFSPILSNLGYGMSWRTGVVLTWGGLRGAVSLALALLVARNQKIDPDRIGNKVLLHTAGIVLLSLLLNATTTKWLLKILGMSDISVPKRMAMGGAVRTLKQTKERTLSMLKTDRFLADSDWDFVDKHTPIVDPYKTNNEEAELANLTYLKRVSVCPDCEGCVPNDPSPKEWQEMEEEARIRLLKAQRTSYWKQFEQGMLSREAVRRLIEMTEEAVDKDKGYMDVTEMKRSWEVRGIYAYLRSRLETWIKSSSYSQIPPPERECLMGPYFAANSIAFEVFIYVAIFTNLIPIVLELAVEDQYEKTDPTYLEIMLSLRIINYIYFIIYLIEAIIKILGFRKHYFSSHWNQLDLVILIFSLVDIILDLSIEQSSLGFQLSATQIVRVARVAKVFRLLRITRALRLFKAVIPPIIAFLNGRINKQLSFGYDVGMGYVVGEEEVRKLLDQMIDDKKIAKKMCGIIESGRLEVVKELGLIQRDMPGIAVSVKTRHAIRVVLNNLRDTISELRGDGLLDDMESSKLEQMVEELMKRQQSAPAYIPPPSPERIMRNIPWIAGDYHLLGFVKQKAKLVSFDYKDVIMKRGDPPKGLYIVVSGLVRVEAMIGDDAYFDEDLFVDYLTTGSIIGEMGLITNKPRNADVMCETAVQSYYLSQGDMNLALQAFQDEPSLEYRLWRVCAIRIAATVLMRQPQYQGMTQEKVKLHLEISYLPDIYGKKTFEIQPSMKDVILIQGYAFNAYTKDLYQGPCYINNTTNKLIFTVKEPGLKNVILVVPVEDTGFVPVSDARSSITGLAAKQASSLCLRHASKLRLDLVNRISSHDLAKRGSVGRLIARASSHKMNLHQLPPVESDKPQDGDFAKRFPKLNSLLKDNRRSDSHLPPLPPVSAVGGGAPRVIEITPTIKTPDEEKDKTSYEDV